MATMEQPTLDNANKETTLTCTPHTKRGHNGENDLAIVRAALDAKAPTADPTPFPVEVPTLITTTTVARNSGTQYPAAVDLWSVDQLASALDDSTVLLVDLRQPAGLFLTGAVRQSFHMTLPLQRWRRKLRQQPLTVTAADVDQALPPACPLRGRGDGRIRTIVLLPPDSSDDAGHTSYRVLMHALSEEYTRLFSSSSSPHPPPMGRANSSFWSLATMTMNLTLLQANHPELWVPGSASRMFAHPLLTPPPVLPLVRAPGASQGGPSCTFLDTPLDSQSADSLVPSMTPIFSVGHSRARDPIPGTVIFIGSADDAANWAYMAELRVGCIITLGAVPEEDPSDGGSGVGGGLRAYHMHRLHIPMVDTLAQELLPAVATASRFIEEHTRSPPDPARPHIFVHCMAGISRSPALVMGYLLWKSSKNGRLGGEEPLAAVDRVFELVQAHRHQASPNLNFLGQLMVLHKHLAAISAQTQNESDSLFTTEPSLLELDQAVAAARTALGYPTRQQLAAQK